MIARNKLSKLLYSFTLAFLAVLAIISTVQLSREAWFELQYPEKQNYTDMDIFVAAAKHFRETGELYQRSENYRDDYAPGAGIYKFPPAYQLTVFPLLALVPDNFSFSFLQRSIQLVLYLSASLMMIVLMERRFLTAGNSYPRWCFRLLAWNFVCHSTGFLDSFTGIEPEIPIYFLLASALMALDKRPALAGVLAATATTLKVYPVLILFYFLAIRNHTACRGYLTGLVVITLISVAVFGIGEHIFYVQHILPVMLTEKAIPHIQNTTIEWMFYYEHGIGIMTGHITLAIKAATAACLLLTSYMALRHKPVNPIILYALYISGLLLCLSNYWLQYQVLLLIPVFCLLAYAVAGKRWIYLGIVLLVILALSIQEGAFQDYKQSVVSAMLQDNQFAINKFIMQHPGMDPVLRFAPHLWFLFRMRELVYLAPLVLFASLFTIYRRNESSH